MHYLYHAKITTVLGFTEYQASSSLFILVFSRSVVRRGGGLKHADATSLKSHQLYTILEKPHCQLI